MRSADSSSSVFGMVLCHRLYAFSLPHDAVQTGSKAAGRVARFCGYGLGIVLRAWWSVCGCLCVPVGTTPPSSRPSVLPLLSAPSFVLAWARSRGDGKRRWCHVSALNATSRVWRLAVRCELISVDGGVGFLVGLIQLCGVFCVAWLRPRPAAATGVSVVNKLALPAFVLLLAARPSMGTSRQTHFLPAPSMAKYPQFTRTLDAQVPAIYPHTPPPLEFYLGAVVDLKGSPPCVAPSS